MQFAAICSMDKVMMQVEDWIQTTVVLMRRERKKPGNHSVSVVAKQNI
jgi:hypothetical protein